jgi:hypothetical protein
MKAVNCVNNLQGKDRDQEVFERNLAINGCRVVTLPTPTVNNTDEKKK